MKDRLEKLKFVLIGIIGKHFINFIFGTMDIRIIGFEAIKGFVESKKVIIAFWHSRLLMVSYLYQGGNGVVLASKSKDGEIIARISKQQGHLVIRGSTSKGGAHAMIEMINALDGSRFIGITPDGPQGPRYKVKPGIIALAKKTGYVIVPVSYSARRIKVFKSWDRFLLPYPFTKGVCIYGAPIIVPNESTRKDIEAFGTVLENELNMATRQADAYYRHVSPL
ncbi:MAG: lysophospholipid acyltransferase family protein [Pseudomonadota bacterium]